MGLAIGYITDERYPSVHTDTQQIVKTADALGAAGCRVDLIPPRMARHLLLSPERRKRAICDHFNVPGRFEVRDLLLWPASDLRAEKLFHGLAAPLAALLRRYDVIYTRNLLPLAVASGLGGPVLFETYRALPRSDPWAWRAVAAASRGRRFLGIATHSELSRRTMIEAGIGPDAVEAIPNGYDPADLEGVPDRAGARALLGLGAEDRIAVYAGHIRPDKGVDALLDLAEDRPDWVLAMAGGSADEVRRLRAEADRRGLGNVRLDGHQPLSRVGVYLSAADVLVLPPTAAPLMRSGRTVLPMKTFAYMAAGRAILAPDLPDTEGVLVHGRNCLRVRPDDRRAAADALARLGREPGLAARLGEGAAEDARGYTWRRRAERLVRFMERRLGAARAPLERGGD